MPVVLGCTNVVIVRAKIQRPAIEAVSMVPIFVPDLSEVRLRALELHSRGQAWEGEAFGWDAEYSPERPEPPLDSKMTFTPADFCIGESRIWFFSMMWENGRDQTPVEFVDDRNLVAVVNAA